MKEKRGGDVQPATTLSATGSSVDIKLVPPASKEPAQNQAPPTGPTQPETLEARQGKLQTQPETPGAKN